MYNSRNGRIILKSNNSVLVQKNNSLLHSDFIFSSCIVQKLNDWSRNPSIDFTNKNYLCGIVKLTRNAIEKKLNYNDGEITNDGSDSWSFGIEFARNVVMVFWC